MGIPQTVAHRIKNIWSHGDDDDYDDVESDDADASYRAEPNPPRYEKPNDSYRPPTYGGGSRRLNAPVPLPVRGREKNIYTLKPKSQDEASIAADYLKTGSAVVLNLDEVERTIAVRIIDFMSGVCYGLDNQGHAMKLGDTIFLFTPGEFEISSDETDYGENPEFFFKDMTPAQAKAAIEAANAPAPTPAPVPERTSPSIERPTVQPRPWER